MSKIKKLPQELVNQIAAGEVIERPASVVKELLDNSLDSGADLIKIKIKNGGLSLIEVSDNGAGISKDMLPLAFEAHSTSKISSIEDLNSLLTMGFRGEALSTIVSISELTAVSKPEDQEAHRISFKGIEPVEITQAARDQGTTVTVQNLFSNIPARRKYMKSADTEYRKILQILIPYFIIYPNISFVLEKDGRTLYNLPKIQGISASTLHPGRFSEVVGGEFAQDMIDMHYEGEGMKIGGLIAHPSFHQSKVNHMYLFVNGRPVSDRGLIRSVMQGYSRYIPHGEKVPFVLMVDIRPDLVDVNVHPRKEEVRFINPYRVYSAVEETVAAALSKRVQSDYAINSGASNGQSEENAYQRLRTMMDRDSSANGGQRGDAQNADMSYGTPTLDFTKRNRSIGDSLSFSENLLRDSSAIEYNPVGLNEGLNQDLSFEDIVSTFQLFKKYIFVEFPEKLWVVDQHAAAERISFEKLLANYNSEAESQNQEVQNLLVPEEIQLSEVEALYIKENQEFLASLGFGVKVEGNVVSITSVPVEFHEADLSKMINELLEINNEEGSELIFDLSLHKEDVIATIACHNSIRSNQRLHSSEGRSLVEQLLKCENPYSCPHGRPIVWRLSLTDLDKNFDRTY